MPKRKNHELDASSVMKSKISQEAELNRLNRKVAAYQRLVADIRLQTKAHDNRIFRAYDEM